MADSRPQESTHVVWRVTPHGAPSVRRHCTRCDAPRAFVPTRNFRVNAQQKRVDIWLIYRCGVCDETWNRPLVERGRVSSVTPERLERLQRNDPGLALGYAFDIQDLRNRGVIVDADLPFTIHAEPISNGDRASPLSITIALARPIETRLDRLLATGLGISRSRIGSLWKSGALRVVPPRSNALQRAPQNGQVVVVEAEALPSASSSALASMSVPPCTLRTGALVSLHLCGGVSSVGAPR